MPITEDMSIFLTRVYEGASSAPIFSVAAEGVSARIEGRRRSTCHITGYSFILMNGHPINWLDSKGKDCWPKAKVSAGIRIEGVKVYYIGEKGQRCELNMSGGTNHGPNKQPRIARLGYLLPKK
tara:strand:- start:1741 stop:2112 length:372 start_codon:yes stop_codon:yes gene_type:complete